MKYQTSTKSTALARLSLTAQHLHLSRCSSTSATPDIIPINQGTKFTPDYTNYATTPNGKIVSYFHDIALNLNKETREANMVVEIPRWTNAKFEINTKTPGNPIVQDIKKGKPNTKHHGLFGDNDPLDVCEIGSKILSTGDVRRVKILGSIALIDDGELDWKVIVINVHDPLFKEVNDINDLDEKCPGLLDTTRQWFRDYKLADGKPQNDFAFNGEYKNANETIDIIEQCHKSWQQLINGETKTDKTPDITNTTVKGSPGFTDTISVSLNNPSRANAAIPVDVEANYFIKTS
ncbi:Inorganic pyrophosphatase family protein [Candida albicans]|uniref:inorganic diphosphatase n=1 Tax=Candida albicans TaxID=5476 RepID=A0A8H6F057_CANAX|nr:Inorganic pyrophosphatase family protein [Candida albicans]